MAISFPSNPNLNDTHVVGNVTWTWNGSSWTALAINTASDVNLTGDLIFEGATADDFEATLTVTDPTTDRTITLPDASGTVALLSDITAYTDSDVDTHLNTSTATANQILSWTGTDYDWVAQSGGGANVTVQDTAPAGTEGDLWWESDVGTLKIYYDSTWIDASPAGNGTGGTTYTDSDVDAHLNTSTATANQILSWDGADYAWVADQTGGGSGLQSRGTVTGTTGSLADAAEADLDITGFKSYALLTITTDRAARVRLYVSAATRTADASRAEGVDPTSDAGLIAEVITTGNETVTISPGAYGFNLESTPTTTIPCRVTNKSGGTATVQVTLNILQLEA